LKGSEWATGQLGVAGQEIQVQILSEAETNINLVALFVPGVAISSSGGGFTPVLPCSRVLQVFEDEGRG
jgi:hypothetical protein